MDANNLKDKMGQFLNAGLYLVTSSELSKGRSSLDVIRAFLQGGGRLVQLREKSLKKRDFFLLAKRALKLCRSFGAILIINDHLDVAAGIEADGVHLGQDDFPCDVARKLFPNLIIGVSTHSREEAIAAQNAGASYINIGPLFPTTTKEWNNNFLGTEGLKNILPYVKIPFTVMGGIKEQHIPELVSAGAKIIAVVTAITMSDDPLNTTKLLLKLIRQEKEHNV